MYAKESFHYFHFKQSELYCLKEFALNLYDNL